LLEGGLFAVAQILGQLARQRAFDENGLAFDMADPAAFVFQGFDSGDRHDACGSGEKGRHCNCSAGAGWQRVGNEQGLSIKILDRSGT